jgi:hypothetical protein
MFFSLSTYLIVTANCSLLAVSRTSSADNENHPPAALQSFTILLWILSPMIEITSFCVVLEISGLQERKIRNLAVLETIVKTVLLCGQQNLVLRGHRDDSQYTNDKNINTGNFSDFSGYYPQ